MIGKGPCHLQVLPGAIDPHVRFTTNSYRQNFSRQNRSNTTITETRQKEWGERGLLFYRDPYCLVQRQCLDNAKNWYDSTLRKGYEEGAWLRCNPATIYERVEISSSSFNFSIFPYTPVSTMKFQFIILILITTRTYIISAVPARSTSELSRRGNMDWLLAPNGARSPREARQQQQAPQPGEPTRLERTQPEGEWYCFERFCPECRGRSDDPRVAEVCHTLTKKMHRNILKRWEAMGCVEVPKQWESGYERLISARTS